MPRFTRRNHGKGHSYTLDGYRIPGVTTVIGTLDKPALVQWAASETAAYADEHWAELSELRSADRIKRLERARLATNRRAIVTGNRVHALGERISRGEQIDPADIAPGERPYVEGYARLLDDWELDIEHTEMPVCHSEYRYAGTLDAIGTSPRLGRVLLDIKTSRRVYAETALQLAAYRYADLGILTTESVGPRGGRVTSDTEISMPEVDVCAIVHVREDSCTLQLAKADQDTWAVFLHLLEVYDTWARPTSWASRDDDDHLNPISDPIYIENHPRRDRA
ncbi:hypothetical protein ACTQ2Q_09815 [Atopobiaceae bacterium LCP21S3_F11]